MLSIDTNILLHAFNEDSPSHKAAYDWLTSVQRDENVAISEFVRTALTMTAQGVTEFASANIKDFEGFGFRRVWNPLITS